MWKHHIPKRMKSPGLPATGCDRLQIYQHGDGPFDSGELAVRLALRVDKAEHGLVEPDKAMPMDEYQAALAATRDDWTVIPEDKEA
jgi:hypothetical protein